MLSTNEKPAATPHMAGAPVHTIPPMTTTSQAGTAGAAQQQVQRPAQSAERVLSFPQVTPLNINAASQPAPNALATAAPAMDATVVTVRAASCVLPEGLKFTGNAFFPCDIEIKGEVDGEIKAAAQKTITVSATGTAKGNLQATNVRIDGKTEGLIKADGGLANFGPSARVSGEVVYGRVSIAEGAEIEASMKKASASAH